MELEIELGGHFAFYLFFHHRYFLWAFGRMGNTVSITRRVEPRFDPVKRASYRNSRHSYLIDYSADDTGKKIVPFEIEFGEKVSLNKKSR